MEEIRDGDMWSYLSTVWGRVSGVSALVPLPIGAFKWIPDSETVKAGFVGGIAMLVAFAVIGLVVSKRLDILESPNPRHSLDRLRTVAKVQFCIAILCVWGMYAALSDNNGVLASHLMFIAMFAFIAAAVTNIGLREHLLKTSPQTFTTLRPCAPGPGGHAGASS